MLEFNEVARSAWTRRSEELARSLPERSVVRVETRLLGNHHSLAESRGHTFEADEAEAFGGGDRGPSPLAYFLASLAFCEQAQVARNAALDGLQLENVGCRVRGYFDPRGAYREDVDNAGFELIRCEVTIQSPESPTVIDALMRRVEKECYVLSTLRRACVIEHTTLHNGEALRAVELT